MPKFIVDSLADGMVTLKMPSNNYRNSFKLPEGVPPPPPPGHRVVGTIHAPAWKIEAVSDGGNYVEPLYGRPRRMQGTVLSVNAAANELTVKTAYEVTVKLPARYSAAAFAVGTRVGWDNIDVPTFTPAVSA